MDYSYCCQLTMDGGSFSFEDFSGLQIFANGRLHSDGKSIKAASEGGSALAGCEYCVEGTTVANGWGASIVISLDYADAPSVGANRRGIDFVTPFEGFYMKVRRVYGAQELRVSFWLKEQYDRAAGEVPPYAPVTDESDAFAHYNTTSPGTDTVDKTWNVMAVSVDVVGGDARTAGPFKVCVDPRTFQPLIAAM